MKSLANGVRAKTARTCDNCLKKRAHWFCAADEAFLCQSCDTSVHSANLLARRHERVRLKDTSPQQEAPTWHHGFTRKPRTPRGSGKRNNSSTFHDMVPEITAEGQTDSSEVEGPLICQVPVLDPMVVEPKIKFPTMRSGVMIDGHEDEDKDESCLNEIFPTNMEVEDFAADVETLLGHGLDKESYTMEELGLSNTEMLKKDEIEDKETKAMNMDIEICDDDQGNRDGTMPFDLNYPQNAYEEDAIKNVESNGECVQAKEEKKKNVLMLSLDYDQVISTWGGQGLPWTSGGPPDIDINISGSPVVSKAGAQTSLEARISHVDSTPEVAGWARVATKWFNPAGHRTQKINNVLVPRNPRKGDRQRWGGTQVGYVRHDTVKLRLWLMSGYGPNQLGGVRLHTDGVQSISYAMLQGFS
ncbi:hypothetical protein DY000_02008617 [Brassica cretica]|uniref:B box-type domain-containing protein n=1 Tax=Brassica cretica TaxID=69181 RepID=A0ABQ7C6E0_BRACR|nr:hypothetical protein DY000_02008617 [Brassica cretica]